MRADVPGADPRARYTLGFERGFAGCLEKQATVQGLAAAVWAAAFPQVRALLAVAAAPGVIDAVLHPPGVSPNPNPYLKGSEEGARLCDWALKVSPAAVARCPSSVRLPSKAPTPCSAPDDAAYGAAISQAAKAGPRRFDCFLCTLAWLKGLVYTPPPNGGTPWTLEQMEPVLAKEAGSTTPQGPQLPCWRLNAQAKGIPISMSPKGIDNEMRAAGDGAKGVVLFINPYNNEIGHVFGVKTVGNGPNANVIYWDDQQLMDGSLWFPSNLGAWISFFRIQ